MQRRVPARGNEPQNRGYNIGREYGVFGTRAAVFGGMRVAEGTDVRNGESDGGSVARKFSGNRGIGYIEALAFAGEKVYFAFGASRGEYRYGKELFIAVYGDKSTGGKV